MAEATPLYQTYNRAPLRFERGEGVWLFTESGERYLDFAAGVAVNSLGHAHPHLVEAIKTQAEKVWHVSNLYEVPGQEKLAKRLTEATFADKVFFTNSGAEALECAIKTARRYHYSKGHPEKFRIITFEGAFHGRTLATIAAGIRAVPTGIAHGTGAAFPIGGAMGLRRVFYDKKSMAGRDFLDGVHRQAQVVVRHGCGERFAEGAAIGFDQRALDHRGAKTVEQGSNLVFCAPLGLCISQILP